MQYLKTAAATLVVAAAMMAIPAIAAADAPICHNGILSDDAGQGCADGLYEQVYGSGGGSTGGSFAGICSDGILSNDAGQGCADGLYERVYGSGGSSGFAPAPAPSGGGGSSNSTVMCESGGDYGANTGNGYYGGWQFDSQTWDAYGDPRYGEANQAPPSVQDQAAARVPYDAWPNC